MSLKSYDWVPYKMYMYLFWHIQSCEIIPKCAYNQINWMITSFREGFKINYHYVGVSGTPRLRILDVASKFVQQKYDF